MVNDGQRNPHPEPWRRRLYLPAYRIAAAARYAETSPQTVSRWHHESGVGAAGMPEREARAALSYLQLIEVAVVAAFRRKGVSLQAVRVAREYAAQMFEKEYPFAEVEFARAGRELLLDLGDVLPGREKGAVVASQWGQRAWDEFLPEFDYWEDGLAKCWFVRGRDCPVLIDPCLSFGAPTVRGVPTWAISGRRDAGETIDEIVEEFALARDEEEVARARADVRAALSFEDAAA